MEQLTNFIELYYTNPEINSLIAHGNRKKASYTRHFNQNEEFFLLLDAPYTVPHFPIHHNIQDREPDSNYIANIRPVLSQLIGLAPDVFADLSYWFDAEEIHKPLFYKLYQYKETYFLYIVRLDLSFRHRAHEVKEWGNNDITPFYKTRHLFLEAHLIPLTEVVEKLGHIVGFKVKQLISQTWIGERGRGYFMQGIWMDDDLSKFFSNLFIAQGKNLYPFYPYICKYKTICQNVITLSAKERVKRLSNFYKSIIFLSPHINNIQRDLQNSHFSEKLPFFHTLKIQVPAALYKDWQDIDIHVYLDEHGMREFIIED